MTPKRYHLALVALHWLLTLLLLVELGLGSTVLQHTANSAPMKLFALRNHMVVGNLILLLTILRFAVRLKMDLPSHASLGSAALDRLATLAHYSLYALTALMAISGLVLAGQANLPAIVFQGIGALPETFAGYSARTAHGVLATLLIALIGGHALAALYHQFICKDGLLGRMWFGRKYGDA
ncbi:cytochrome b561 [Rhodoblastus acidophilus]|uniref:cytochrome b n=1 Tax=Rhodoblastus acidophilus TaxID=1074 RepID=UPI00222468E1|nr:cytochrome b/b6 domain-containing protein [Rhodoblastus acidophilus]MCW2319003.1 cytochrome b561 [Rhodoblastus acidophilus]